MTCKIVDGFWTEPEVASFIKNEFTFEPFVTTDNKRLYFQSGRVIDGALQMVTLYVNRDENGDWGGIEDQGSYSIPTRQCISLPLIAERYTPLIFQGVWGMKPWES